ncbi:MAG: hypothetical protein CSB03_00160 [Bacteroidia bacterium]|nr:MAG: hypothetical protein CSB03_00160 [Bacteroidia bacterium]
MKNFVNRYLFEIIGGIVGFIGGFLYWYYVGCASGTCVIKSNWYVMSPYGMILGILLGGIVKSIKRKK